MPDGIWAWAYAVGVGVLAGVLTTGTIGGAVPESDKSDRSAGYRIVNGAIPERLTDQPGDPERGRRVVLDREAGDCIVCHAMPLPQRQFHGTVGPPLDGVGKRYTASQLRLRLVDPKAINPATVMPAYYKVEGLHRVLERYRGKPILTAQQVEDVVVYLLTLQQE
jgi:sulfur-oxidizing protein SoxX